MIFEGQLSPADNRSYIRVPFDVVEGTTGIHIAFDHEPKHTQGQPLPQQISLSVFDPQGIRGEHSYRKRDGLFIGLNRATPGSLAGPIEAGPWTVLISIHRIMPGEPVRYRGEISLTAEATEGKPIVWNEPAPSSRGAGWYKGDIHAHTYHSDGSWAIPDLIRYAQKQKLDFVTLSDHNTISGLAEHRSKATEALLTLGGIELSTFYGHAVALGVQEWFEWRKPDGSILTMHKLAQKVLDAGAFLTIAHPRDEGDPQCCGCRWEHVDMMPGNAPAVEIWNGVWGVRNEEALQLYYSWLNQGHKLVATTGSDLHDAPPPDQHRAVNVVYAEAFSEAGIVEALKRGHSYISAGPELRLHATNESSTGMMGDILSKGETSFEVNWKDAHEGVKLRVIVNGRVNLEQPIKAVGELSWQQTMKSLDWCAVELRDASSNLWALSNPLFFRNDD